MPKAMARILTTFSSLYPAFKDALVYRSCKKEPDSQCLPPCVVSTPPFLFEFIALKPGIQTMYRLY